MHHHISSGTRRLLARVQCFVEREVLPLENENRRVIEDGVVSEEFVSLRREIAQRSVAAGCYGMPLPKDVGGLELGELQMSLVREQVYGVHSHLAVMTLGDLPYGPNRMLYGLASHEQRERYVRPLMRAELTSGLAISEPGAGSDLTAIRSAARRTSRGWILNGVKHLVSNGPYADFLQVLARASGRGFTFFLVPRTAFRIARLQPTMGGDDLPAEITFDDAFIPDDDVLGEPGKGLRAAVGYLSLERLSIASIAIGSADLALRLAIDHLGRPMRERAQALSFLLADSEVELYAARAMSRDVTERLDLGEQAFVDVAKLKLFCSEMAARVVDRAIEVVGPAACLRGSPLERLYRLVRLYRIGGGTSEIQRMIIASAAFQGERQRPSRFGRAPVSR